MILPDEPAPTSGHIIITPQAANLVGLFNAEVQTGTTAEIEDEEN